ncbi:type II toxin-antitoxin system RelE/ParE family toxin [Argonema galeatum]|uniref:type II toxin-antitoxin system RelE/ParE family toxin n=1 Tax=Argonema galeatum TaxID=2942762 RepID=UPI0020138154|nr:type II toxin-antitoxin system RelE/ParE family toxin [Argonema galeatum]MCL1463541.1 type II toxin-antitoxin system RelE/ParE family toxin [Argonema galeatum A003/A1]
MSRYIISPSASRDLNEIIDYFASRNVEAGERLLTTFVKRCQKLINFPMMGRSYEDIRSGLRGVPLDGHIILYQVTANTLEILRAWFAQSKRIV